MRIYVASSWRNEYQDQVVKLLRLIGHQVYDFKNPPHGRTGFAWSDIDPNWENWTSDQYKQALSHPLSEAGFKSDFDGMKWAEVCVMVLPCGRSANTEAGWMKGNGKHVFVFSPIAQEPELMYKIYDGVITSFKELEGTFSLLKRVEKLDVGELPPHTIHHETMTVFDLRDRIRIMFGKKCRIVSQIYTKELASVAGSKAQVFVDFIIKRKDKAMGIINNETKK